MAIDRRTFALASAVSALTAAGLMAAPRAAVACTAYLVAYFTESPQMGHANYLLRVDPIGTVSGQQDFRITP